MINNIAMLLALLIAVVSPLYTHTNNGVDDKIKLTIELDDQHSSVLQDFTLSQDLKQVIQRYKDPEYVATLVSKAKKYGQPGFISQDFLHKVLHPREVKFEFFDNFNKQLLYQLPSIIKTPDNKKIGLFMGDVMSAGSQLSQWYVNKKSITVLLDTLTTVFTQFVIENDEKLITLLEAQTIDVVTQGFMDALWAKNGELLYPYLQQRLIHLLLEYVKKNTTPPPFYFYGKTSYGKSCDDAVEDIAPLMSVIPMGLTEAFFDSSLDANILTTHNNFSLTDLIHSRPGMLVNIALQYSLEFAKQLKFIDTTDETLLFITLKETLFSTLFFYYSCKKIITSAIKEALYQKSKPLLEVLKKNRALTKESSLSSEDIKREQAIYHQAIKAFFTLTLQQKKSFMISTLYANQSTYNIVTTLALFAYSPSIREYVKHIGDIFYRYLDTNKGTE